MTDMVQESFSSSDAPLLLSDDSCTHFLGQFSTFGSEENEESDLSSCHSVSSLLDLDRMDSSVSTPTLSTSSSMSSTLSSSCEIPDLPPKVLPLSSQERKEHYAWLDSIIGPASGIQESMGTYKEFMEQQREVYYNRLLLIAELPTKKVVSRRATNEFISWLGGTATSGLPTHESPPSVVTAPRVDADFTRRTIALSGSGCWSSPGPSLPGRTDPDIYSRTQGVVAALSVPQLNSRLGCPITRHPRRRTFSAATVDM
jgi:hypothetical protein